MNHPVESMSKWNTDTIEIRMVDSSNVELRQLINHLDLDLLERYPPEAVFGLDFNAPHIDKVTFAVAFLNHVAVGCGALRPLDAQTMELKRFYVNPAYRRRGIASLLLCFLEGATRDLNYMSMKLETGLMQPESIQLYRKFGFHEIARYGEYIHCKQSICFEKWLLPYTICFIKRAEQILLVNRERAPWMGSWNGVGGKLSGGETALACVLREVYEETEILLEQADFKGTVTWQVDGKPRSGMYLYVAEVTKDYIYHTPKQTAEGILDWKTLDWILHPTNSGLATNIPHFIPIMLEETDCYNHHCLFDQGRLTHVQSTIIST